jgi:hypothetical protein
MIDRYPKNVPLTSLPFLKDGNIIDVDWNGFKAFYKIDSVIKMFPDEFRQVPSPPSHLIHFNLEYSGHKPNHQYLITCIETGGSYDGVNYLGPIMRAGVAYLSRCITVTNNVQYTDIDQCLFVHSLSDIQSVWSLKKNILHRYKRSLPNISDDVKLSLGVSITELELFEEVGIQVERF